MRWRELSAVIAQLVMGLILERVQFLVTIPGSHSSADFLEASGWHRFSRLSADSVAMGAVLELVLVESLGTLRHKDMHL